ncbi:Ninein [Frankliniella fusca]|uniref:Ninein n=1 Tax=Frankliniella fusca TaxID=407009 RepID=A0AAE1H433_9NEOP|nr:Ninein [Frankliniella fusca]
MVRAFQNKLRSVWAAMERLCSGWVRREEDDQPRKSWTRRGGGVWVLGRAEAGPLPSLGASSLGRGGRPAPPPPPPPPPGRMWLQRAGRPQMDSARDKLIDSYGARGAGAARGRARPELHRGAPRRPAPPRALSTNILMPTHSAVSLAAPSHAVTSPSLARGAEKTTLVLQQQVQELQQARASWLQFEQHLQELRLALRQDQEALLQVDRALQAGGALSPAVASSVREVARALSEKHEGATGTGTSTPGAASGAQGDQVSVGADVTRGGAGAADIARLVDAMQIYYPYFLMSTTVSSLVVLADAQTAALRYSEGGSLSDSGISDTGSDQEASERERRLAGLRRLARQLEAVLGPGSSALDGMREDGSRMVESQTDH